MDLKQLLNIHGRLDWRDQLPEKVVLALSFDSRKVSPDCVYVAIRGSQSDGHDFLQQAVDAGALALVVEDVNQVPKGYLGAVLEVLDSRLSLQVLSQKFYGHPGDRMAGIAVTGTNGKTSSAYMIEFLLGLVGKHCGVIGTIDHHLGGQVFPTSLTTPDPVTLQKRLQDFLDLSADAFVIEASSHALEQNRIHQGFDVCLFTNLSRDHLDYHKTMEAYFQSKARLFQSASLKDNTDHFAVINGDDPYGRRLLEQVHGRKVFLYGQAEDCHLRFKILSESLDGSQVELTLLGKEILTFQVPLLGLHNVYNMVGAIGVLHSLGFALAPVVKDIVFFKGVPGRMQGQRSRDGIYGFVDYAHTPEALEQSLKALKAQVGQQNQLICVFGCGGDRDKGKRPMMGQVALSGADQVIVTSDNPRTEEPLQIINEIVSSQTNPHLHVQADRSLAIKTAVGLAQPGDVILVAGKGHEDYQVIGNKKIDFSDYKQLQESFKNV